jgi:hypothetical protein
MVCGYEHFSLSDMLLATRGGFGTLFVPLSHSDPLWVLLFWLRFGSSLFVPSFPPLLCALFTGVSSFYVAFMFLR